MSKVLVSAAASLFASTLAFPTTAHADIVEYQMNGTITQDIGDNIFFSGFSVGDTVQYVFAIDDNPASVSSSTSFFNAESVTISVTSGGSTTSHIFDNLNPSFRQATVTVTTGPFATHDANWTNFVQDGFVFGIRLIESSSPDTSLNNYVQGTLPDPLDPTTFDAASFRFLDFETGIAQGFAGTVDSITIIPAPGAAALLAMGGIAATRRRR